MELLGYSERGLINGLLYEIVYCRSDEEAKKLIGELFELVNWPSRDPAADRPFKKDDASMCSTILVEQSFSQFGTPDALFHFQNGRRRMSVFWEAKRGRKYDLEREWNAFVGAFHNEKGFKGLTSNVFCQLYFKQHLARALGSDSGEDLHIGLTLEAPLRRRGGGRKIGSNEVVRKALSLLGKPPNDCVFYVMMIPSNWGDDQTRWWNQNVARPSSAPGDWDVSNWGVITIPEIAAFCQTHGLNRTLAVIEHNKGQLYVESAPNEDPNWLNNRGFKGVSVIYAPKINPGTCLHFSWGKKGCALRDYSGQSETTPPIPDSSRTTAQVISLVQQGREKRLPRLHIDQVTRWRQIIQQVNDEWKIGASSAPGP